MSIRNGQIVVGVDDSPQSLAAVRWAAREAALHKNALTLVHVLTSDFHTPSAWAGVPVYPSRAHLRRAQMAAYQKLQAAQRAAMDAIGPSDSLRVHHEVLMGPVAATLTAAAQHADMLAVGCGNRNVAFRTLFGSTRSDLIHRARCAVAFIHNNHSPTARSPQEPVLVGVDGSPASDQAIEIAFDEASRRGVDLIAFHAWNDEGPIKFGRPAHAPIEWANFKAEESEVLGERLAGWGDRYPDVAVRKIVAADRPVPGLLRLAQKAQLLILGSHDDRFVDRLHRSVRSAVVAASAIPVIIAGHTRRV